MRNSNLIRWSGLAAILGGALLLLSDLLSLTVLSGDPSEIATTGAYLADSGTRLLAGILLLIGLVGLYARQAEAAGTPGLAAFLLAFAGTSLMCGTWWTNAFVPPVLATEGSRLLETGPTGVLAFGYTMSYSFAAVGWLLFGLVSLRTRIYPRAAVGALVVGAALNFVPLPGSQVVFVVAVVWLGLSLFSQGVPVRRPEREGNPANLPVQ